MTKKELVNLVDKIYATYNNQLPVDDEGLQAVYSAWWDLLHDLDAEETREAFLSIAVHAEFMPRPGALRRKVIDTRIKIPQFDEPIVAWGKWITLSKEVHSGMPPSIPVSDALKLTVQQIGEPAYGMHTNADREAFCRTYEKVVSQLEAEKYAVPSNKTTEQNKGN